MRRKPRRAPFLLVPLMMCTSATAGVPTLDSREYKLPLSPSKFEGSQIDVNETVDLFWTKVLKPLIARRLDAQDDGDSRAKKNFALDKERVIKFLDTDDCVLTQNGFSLRVRTDVGRDKDDKSPRELTIKYRTSDMFLAAAMILKGGAKTERSKFEEDISPAGNSAKGTDDRSDVRASFKSLFSASTKELVGDDTVVNKLGDAFDIYPTLKNALQAAGADKAAFKKSLKSGPVLSELAFDGAKVDLGPGVNADLTITIWYSREPAKKVPVTAEVSFKYKTDKGTLKAAVARRALVLFEAMQDELGEWLKLGGGNKTSLGLPDQCRKAIGDE